MYDLDHGCAEDVYGGEFGNGKDGEDFNEQVFVAGKGVVEDDEGEGECGDCGAVPG